MSFSTILSAVIEGLEVAFIHVEADISNGLPVFHMVGYLSSEVKEAGERVRTAIKNSGFEYPAKRTVVNLSPATMRKHGASFDLPIAVAILTALGQIEQPEKTSHYRRTQPWGSVKKVSGVLPIIMEAKEKGVKKCIVPLENVSEALLVSEMEIIGAATLQEAVEACGKKEKGKKREGKQI
ncbi:MAG: magnesium chelatase domain-containing protein [Anaerobutyricum sp.]